jgi:flavin reductase (DIM6/NTAB) family NADH-FMN oxidoreductase RutF
MDPFATPADLREPARRLRGRLAAPVTVWTAGAGDAAAALTVSSLLVAEGEPARVLGLLGDLTDVWEALRDTGTFTVHVLERGHRALADRFAGRVPIVGGLFAGLDVAGSPYGPVLRDVGTRAACRFEDATPVGYGLLVRGRVEQVDVGDAERPLVYFRGRYRGLDER